MAHALSSRDSQPRMGQARARGGEPGPSSSPSLPLGHRRRALLLARDDLRLADLLVQR